ncbi:MAG: acyl-CoA thioesterase [Pirellula sp.]
MSSAIPEGIYVHELMVTDSDIDMVGHVNNVVYIQWMQDAALAHSAALGWSADRYQALGAGWVARLHQIEYLQPAYPGERVIVKTWVADMRKVTSTRRYQIVRHVSSDSDSVQADREVILAIAHTNWAFIDFQTGSPKRIPAEIASAYQIVE